MIILILIILLSASVYAEMIVNGDTKINGDITVWTKDWQRITKGKKPITPTKGQYYKNKEGKIYKWNGKTWDLSKKTIKDLTGKDKIKDVIVKKDGVLNDKYFK